MPKKKTKEDFIKEARKVHGDKYDYSKVEYLGTHTKVCIICPEHMEFWQAANSHLRGIGCPKCSREKKTSTKEAFIKKARKVHGNKYDYSKVEYVNSKTKVCIICTEHGKFWQRPSAHVRGQGCTKCGNETIRQSLSFSKEDFIEKAREVHGQKYDYSKVDYVNNKTKVCIVCPEHGKFWQAANSHLSGCGCPKCSGVSVPTTEEWIASARKVHGDKYDYSNAKYVNAHTKVCIICSKPEHGEFWQTPDSHVRSCGCPKCGDENRSEKQTSTKEEFIKKAREIHGDKYDYSKVEYDGAHTKVCIICPEHGKFEQRPSGHLKGYGCPKCANEAKSERCRSSKEDFIKKSRKVHGDKYDYSKVDYVNAQTKVCIKCPVHGEFWQIPYHHTKGCGCTKCMGDKTRERLTLSKEEFIKKAREVHGDKYDYSNVDYINAKTKVCIICPEHGEFLQKPNNHTQGQGCPKCGGSCVLITKDFIKKAHKVHGDNYDYSKVEYVKSNIKVRIICSKHGEFLQSPNKHLMGKGCPKCNLSHLERNVMNYLDDVGITYDYQKRFKWLGLQSLDFYLPDYNVGIECQGRQHFFPVERFGGDEGFKKTLQRDKRKKALCEEHGVKLLYFGNVPNYDTFLGEVVHGDVQYLIDYLNEHKIDRDKPTTE